jgi:DNA end-binding protein Ku
MAQQQGIWSGTISFSLVAIPVRLVKAVEPGRVSFRMLHNRDYSPLLRRMFCPREETMVSSEEIVRGYEIGPEQYILITDEELESLTPERSRTIEIIQFIEMKEVDPVYLDHPYYLVPSKGGEKAYRLLVEVMDRTQKVGIAKFVLGEREHLVAVRSMEGVLSLITLHYSEDILPYDGIIHDEGRTDPEEENRLRRIIKEMTVPFNPERYSNERRRRITELVDEKITRNAAVEAPAVTAEEGEGPVDLVAALEESMRKIKEGR